MTFLALASIGITVGSWWWIRWTEESQKLSDVTTYLLSIPADEWRGQ